MDQRELELKEIIMSKFVVLIPEGFFVKYFIYSDEESGAIETNNRFILKKKGKIKFRGSGTSNDDIKHLIRCHKPEAVAVKILYGGNEFNKVTVYDQSVMAKLENLVPQSPLHVPLAIKLIKLLKRTIPEPEIFLFFETAFFADLPLQERVYALNNELFDMNTRRFGYHGLFHDAALGKMERNHGKVKRIISICLEPVPEVAAIYNGKPVMVSSGSTPLDGLPGDTTCGEIDPGIILLLEEKKKWGPEIIDHVLTRKSGLSAIAEKMTTIEEVFCGNEEYIMARKIFEYRILLSCGSAMALMNGFDGIAFSGKYVGSAEKLCSWLLPKLTGASKETFDPGSPAVYFLRDSLEEVILDEALQLTR